MMQTFICIMAHVTLVFSRYACIHDNMERHQFLISQESLRRNLEEVITVPEPAPIRIKAGFEKIDEPALQPPYRNRIKQLVLANIELLAKFVKVKQPATSNIKFNAGSFDPSKYPDITVGDIEQNPGISDCDLYLWIGWKSDPSKSYLAFAGAIQLDSTTNRPVFGQVVFNIYQLKSFDDTMGFQEQMQTTLHEIFHVLAMSSDLFSKFIGIEKAVENDKLKTPNVIDKAKSHFNCDSVDGMPLEDFGEGSKGSHWEQSYLRNELMTAENHGNMVLTSITLALLEDSGWYSVDYQYAEETDWGRNQGCEFYNQLCDGTTKFREFCETDGDEGVDFFYQGVGRCSSTDFTKCKTVQRYENSDCWIPSEKFGDNEKQYLDFGFGISGVQSSAFESTFWDKNLKNSGIKENCYQYEIVDSTKIKVKTSNDDTYELTSGQEMESKSSDLYIGKIKGPDARFWTQVRNHCTDDCSMQGLCMNSSCVCLLESKPFRETCTCDSNCITCKFNSNKMECGKCNSGSILNNGICDLNETCKTTVENCISCVDDKTCFKCASSFYLAKMKSQSPQCQASCDQTKYYVNQIEKECILCPTTCKGCDVNLKCVECASGLYFDKIGCVACDQKNQLKVGHNCSTCHKTCKSCSGLTEKDCKECADGYLQFKDVNQCVQNCPIFTTINDGICTICQKKAILKGILIQNKFQQDKQQCVSACTSGYYQEILEDSKYKEYAIESFYKPQICQPCSQTNCKQCTEPVACEICMEGYFLTSKGLCNPCMKDCKSCKSSDACLDQTTIQNDSKQTENTQSTDPQKQAVTNITGSEPSKLESQSSQSQGNQTSKTLSGLIYLIQSFAVICLQL